MQYTRTVWLAGVALCAVVATRAQTLSFTASPNPGASPLTTTVSWTTTNISGSLPHYVRITGESFDPTEDLSTSGNRTVALYNGTASNTQSSFSAALWRFDYPPPYSGARITCNVMQFVEGTITEINAGSNPTFTIWAGPYATLQWNIGIPGCYINGGDSQPAEGGGWLYSCSVVIPSDCPTGDYDISVTDGSDGDSSALLKLLVNGVPGTPTVRTDTGINANLQVTITPDETSTVSANPPSGEAPVVTTVSWSAADYGSGFGYWMSGPGFSGNEAVARTGSRAVVAPGIIGQDKTNTYSLQVRKKFPVWSLSAVNPNADFVNQTLTFAVTGTINGGTIEGNTSMYSANSPLNNVAVHAGLVAVGASKNISVLMRAPTGNPAHTVAGTTSHGVTSYGFNAGFDYYVNPSAGPDDVLLLQRSVVVTAYDRPTAPTISVAEITATSVTLVWQASRDQVGIARYKILRNGTEVGSTTDLAFVDNGLNVNTAYTYTVEAVGLGGRPSLASNSLPVTTAQASDDSNGDGLPNSIAGVLNTTANMGADTSSQTEQNIHRPIR